MLGGAASSLGCAAAAVVGGMTAGDGDGDGDGEGEGEGAAGCGGALGARNGVPAQPASSKSIKVAMMDGAFIVET